jgi:hypothetical protein
MNRTRSLAATVLWVFILCIGGGCGPAATKRAAVKGRVMIDGAPLPNGLIEFIPVDKQKGQPGGSAIENGHYAISAENGLFAGDYQVRIRADRPTGKKVWDGMGDESWPASKKNFVNVMESYIPPRYNDRSTLTATIEPGKVNEWNYNLQLDKK